jgi:predicted nucleotidyltransferase
MPTIKPRRVKETRTAYRAQRAQAKRKAGDAAVRWSEIDAAAEPIILQRNGQPVAVVVKYDEYLRLENVRKEQATVPMPEIQKIVDIIAEKFSPDKIILFGSYADGVPRRGSDVDLLVVMDFEGSPIDKAIEVTGILGRRNFGLDLLIRTQTEIERRIALDDWFLEDIVTKGKVLYARADRRMDRES